MLKMDIRDEFAAKAMHAEIIATNEWLLSSEGVKAPSANDIAKEAYKYADAMLKERNRNDKN